MTTGTPGTCTVCGVALSSGQRFCPNCGHQVGGSASARAGEPVSPPSAAGMPAAGTPTMLWPSDDDSDAEAANLPPSPRPFPLPDSSSAAPASSAWPPSGGGLQASRGLPTWLVAVVAAGALVVVAAIVVVTILRGGGDDEAATPTTVARNATVPAVTGGAAGTVGALGTRTPGATPAAVTPVVAASPTPAPAPTGTPAPRLVDGLLVVDEVWVGRIVEEGGLRIRSAPRLDPANVLGSVTTGTRVNVQGKVLNGQEAEAGKGTVWLIIGPSQYIYNGTGYVERVP